MRAARPCKRKLWGILPGPFESRPYGEEERHFIFHAKILARPARKSRAGIGSIARKPEWQNRAYRGSFPRNLGGSLETISSSKRQEEACWLIERTWLSERTSEGTIAYSWRGGHDRRYRRASGTVNAQNSGWCQWTRPCEESAGASSSAILAISGSCLSHGTETNFVTLRKRRGARVRADNTERDEPTADF